MTAESEPDAQDATPEAPAPAGAADERPLTGEPVDAQIVSGKPQTAMWFGLLIIYLLLFMTTGYLAFLNPDRNPGAESQELIAGIEDPETKAYVIETLQEEDAEHAKRQDFANQSFNVVLGALLGFMSASATSFLRGRGDA